MHKHTGITIVELMLVVIIVALLGLVGIPGLSGLLMTTRMNSSVNDLFHSLHRAHQNAMVTGVSTVICGSDDGRQCSDHGNWSRGWLMFSNVDNDSPPRITPGDRIMRNEQNPTGLVIHANRPDFALNPFGARSTNGTLVWCDRRGGSHARAIIVSYTGKPRMTRTTASGKGLTCPGE